MLRVFFGKGAIEVRRKAFAFVSKMEEEGYALERVEAEAYVPGLCSDIANSLSLFGGKKIYLLDTPSLDALFDEEVHASLAGFKESADVFVIIESSLLAPAKKAYAKYAEAIEEIEGTVAERFNAFSMADSLSSKDKKTLWLQLQEAKQGGLSAEEIIGTLWWQLKTLRLASLTSSSVEAGMKDFPYNKAKRSLKNFKEGELIALSQSLLSLYHDGHLGKRDIDLALEKWTLTI